jgi:5-methylthioadenosine/S-adenosylhomocysteine deaminase
MAPEAERTAVETGRSEPALLIRGGRVYRHDGDVDDPAIRDILIRGSRIVSVTAPDEEPALKQEIAGRAVDANEGQVIDARGKLVLPGFVNAHYHSYDVLAKGLLEDMPFDVWALHSQPAYFGRRSKAEIRIRTLLGALECLQNGVTTIQDMNSLVPQDEETLDTILSAYEEIGIRVVFSIAVRDIGALDIAPFLAADVPESVMTLVRGVPKNPREEIAFVERQIKRLAPLPPRMTWGLSPSGPQRSSRALLEGVADLSRRHALPVFTHVYETKAQTAKAREIYGEHGGSMIRHLADVGLLTPRTTIAHGVWLTQDEIALMAEHGSGVAHNPVSNLKLKSGVAPVCDLRDSGVRLALGCDNCSGSDVQSVFQAMKMFCLLAAVSEPEPGPGLAHEVLRHATLGNARTAGLERELGAIRPGYKADLILIDLDDAAYLPYNSAARQLVYTESGRAVESVIVNGRIVMQDRKIKTIDEDALRREVAGLMRHFIADYEAIVASRKRALPYMLEAHRKVWQADVGLNRFIPRTR